MQGYGSVVSDFHDTHQRCTAQELVSAKTETQGPKQRSLQLDPGV